MNHYFFTSVAQAHEGEGEELGIKTQDFVGPTLALIIILVAVAYARTISKRKKYEGNSN